MSQRALIAVVIAAAVVVGAAGVLYAFGTPTGPSPQATVIVQADEVPARPAAAAPAPAEAAPSEATEAPGEPTPPDPDSPLAIEIPGCVCHSDDPQVVEEHAGYRMNQCAGCHAGGVPTGAE